MAAIYLIDRHEGKAKQVQNLSITPNPYTQDDYELMAQVRLAEQKLLAEYSRENGHENLMETKELDV
ncbi:hypothetical protein ACFLV0_05615 [Chloroflexota bacterium]